MTQTPQWTPRWPNSRSRVPACRGVDSDRAEIPNVCDFVTVDELAAEIGVNRKTLYNFIQMGFLPGVRRICGRITIHRPTVIEWYRTGKGAVPRSRSKS